MIFPVGKKNQAVTSSTAEMQTTKLIPVKNWLVISWWKIKQKTKIQVISKMFLWDDFKMPHFELGFI